MLEEPCEILKNQVGKDPPIGEAHLVLVLAINGPVLVHLVTPIR